MSDSIKYDAACRALIEAISIDEVKDIRDKSQAMHAFVFTLSRQIWAQTKEEWGTDTETVFIA